MIPLLLTALGLILGSFVNAFVWRIHNKKNWVSERSECTHCHHKLSTLDLIPVVSYVLLRGKCRYCHKKIDDTPLAELALPSLFLLSYYFWPYELAGRGAIEFGFWLVLLVGLLALTIYDFRWFLLPDKIVFPLVGLAAVQVAVVAVCERDWHLAVTAVGGAVIISGLFYLIFQVSKGTWIGGGDVKLGLLLGLLVGGVLPAFLLLFSASLVGLFASLPAVMKGKAGKKTQIPFGPFLIIGLIIVKLFGVAILDWYAGILYV
jgi:prepilin signal peptidase PulO-like enzyme (type II secretory pathway)